jgi:hypothetical protein
MARLQAEELSLVTKSSTCTSISTRLYCEPHDLTSFGAFQLDPRCILAPRVKGKAANVFKAELRNMMQNDDGLAPGALNGRYYPALADELL